MEHALVKVTNGELYPYLKDITLCGRVEDGESWGTIGKFYIYGCKDEEQKQFYKGILAFDKGTGVIGLQTVEEVEEFWLDGCDGMFLTIEEGDYEIIEKL
ncbi:hypothetical protein ACR77J_17215 [Tissierella praeacuta]|uniref:hypothetical protein n=1 Tax=Tissierella praeacuta TaxID=43131 RepID=UPI003DA51D49